MTTAPHRTSSPARGSRAATNPMTVALRVVTKVSASPIWDRLGIRPQAENALRNITRRGAGTGIKAARAARTFAAKTPLGAPQRQSGSAERPDLFDLTPSEDQTMLVEVVREFAAEKVRPVATDADRDCRTPEDVLATSVELGVLQLSLPEKLGGITDERSAVSNVLVTEALAHGDLGIAVACLAPAAVATALSLWGDAAQQATYLPAFAGENPPAAALCVTEPNPLFDPLKLTTRAVRSGEGYVLDGVKSMVPGAERNELFLVAAQVVENGRETGPALFVVESSTAGLGVTPEPAMGLRPAQTGRLVLDGVSVPLGARIGTTEDNPYRECLRLSRIAWAALAVGTGQAVLDYVVPYVNDRVAFGEPISHRQGVAFIVADLATELEGLRLATYRAASRADQGLDFAREAALAARLAAEYGMRIGNDGVQLLGGHGYVKDHPVERWYRDLRAVGLMDGVVLV